MPPIIATAVFLTCILGLFWLDRDPQAKTSKALWIPVIWLLLAGSRNVSEWMDLSPLTDSPDRYLEGNPLDRIVQSGLLVLAAIVLARRGRTKSILLANVPILLYFGYCGVSLLWSDYPDLSFKRWVKALGDVIMVLVVLTDLNPFAALRRLVTRIGFFLVPISILFIRYYPDFGRAYSRWEGTMFYTGVTTNKNTLGMVCLVVGLGSLWRFTQILRSPKSKAKKGPLIAHGILLAMVMWLLHMANSATSLSCFVLAGGLIVATSFRVVRTRPAVVHLLVASVLLISFSALFLDIGSGMLAGIGRNSTLTGRTTLWAEILRHTVSPLFGAGYETFWVGPRMETIWAITGQHPNEAHDGYLEVYMNLGWIGVSLLAVLMVTGYRNIIRDFRRHPEEASLRLAFFVAAAAYNFTEAAFKMMHPRWIFLLLSIVFVPRFGKRGKLAAGGDGHAAGAGWHSANEPKLVEVG
jgi:exopolysaccharide production protein ExoQ